MHGHFIHAFTYFLGPCDFLKVTSSPRCIFVVGEKKEYINRAHQGMIFILALSLQPWNLVTLSADKLKSYFKETGYG